MVHSPGIRSHLHDAAVAAAATSVHSSPSLPQALFLTLLRNTVATALPDMTSISPSHPALLKPGTYMLRNDCHGTALTLSAEDHRTISGAVYDPRESPYQTWTFIAKEKFNQFLIRASVSSPDGRPLYLALDDPNGLRQDAAIIASPRPMTWACYYTVWGEMNPVRANQSSYNGLFFEAVRSKRQGQIALQRYVRRHPPLECRVDGGSEGLTVDVP
ncbi:hypothetical protein VTO73DRAFT_10334 [Trametes versicolor]